MPLGNIQASTHIKKQNFVPRTHTQQKRNKHRDGQKSQINKTKNFSRKSHKPDQRQQK